MATLPPPKDESCVTCALARYRQYGDTQVIECRAMSPRGVIGTKAMWPQVEETDWCGEFKAPGA